MRQGRRTISFGVLLCAMLLLSGCAAGSPSVVVPAAPETSFAAAAIAPEPAAPIAETSAVPVAVEAPAAVEAAPVDNSVGSSSRDAPELVEAPAGSTASFAQDVPVVAPRAETAPTVSESVENPVAAPPTLQLARPPAPPAPESGLSLIVEGGPNDRLEVALTFDAGADRGYGAEILDLLRAEGIPATFGMTGLWAEANPDLVQRMVAEGHQLMNHTWDHSSLTGANTGMPPQSPEQVAEQLASTESVVREATGYEMRPYFRPPYGDYDEPTLRYLYDNGYYLSIWWTCDSHGWAGWLGQEIVDYCTTNIRPHEILLLHVGAAAAGDFEALPGLIQFFRESGYSFVTVEQMLQP